jgi:putative ABC transport system substrate-binding protein
MPVIGLLGALSLDNEGVRSFLAAFRNGLAGTGYVEGRNVAFEYRFADNHFDRLPALAAELVQRKVAVIVAGNTASTVAAKAATKSIPIVFQTGSDPVAGGFIARLSRPGGNLTGITNFQLTVTAKRLELLHELVPAASSIALLTNPANTVAAEAERRELEAAAAVLGVRLLAVNASYPSEFEQAFLTLVREHAGALLVGGDNLFRNYLDRIVALAARNAVPAVYAEPEFTAAGGLMSYGTDIPNSFRQVGVYAGRILKGEKPADLPVQQVTKIELVINMKTAKALGLTFPLDLLGRADEVIE